MTDQPGTVTNVSGFKGTVCTPKAWREILRIIQDGQILARHWLLWLAGITNRPWKS
jgi:hypothetical protein